MGWFDEDDEDDDDEDRKQKQPSNLMSMMMDTKPQAVVVAAADAAPSAATLSSSSEPQQGETNTTEKDPSSPQKSKEKEGEEEEDALDAYMKSLGDEEMDSPKVLTASKDEAASSGGRLDMENEDEATGHWETTQQEPGKFTNHNGEASLAAAATSQSEFAVEAAYALESTFHKASNQLGDPRKINIQLQQVQHDQMDYSDFTKCLLTLDQSNKFRNNYEGHKWRKENQVHCNPPLDPIYDFAELRDVLPEQILEWNATMNITKPTLVQSQTLGVALAGKDVITTSSTGSGKTLTYLWPMTAHLMANQTDSKKSRALVMVPTKELALQVEQVAKSLFAKLPITVLAITGGNLGRYQLSQKLQSTKPHCVIATPGRLLDVLSAQQKSKQDWLLPNITLLVLDEADKMIQFGFANQVTQILQNLRPDRQSLLVSATFDSRLQRRCQEWMHQPTRISIGKTGQSSKHVTQHVLCLPDPPAKVAFLKETLPTFVDVGRTLVFCATRHGVEDLATQLRTVLPVETLHGDRHPVDRKAALKAFTNGDVKVLVATDVAGRGLDIPQVSTVVNFDPPKNWETHLHRIGRSGRLSAEDQKQHQGSAYTLLLPSNGDFAKALIRAYEREDRPVPEEVRQLAENSKQNQGSSSSSSSNNNNYNGHARKSYNRSGLGYPPQDDNGGGGGGRSWQGPPKRGRWS
jgi:ATP-dependent RNA helicase DDX42